MRLINLSQNNVLASKVKICRSLLSRMRGLLGTSSLAPEEACWLLPCNSIHTIGMQYSIDAYFLDKKNRIVSIFEDLKPCRLSPIVWKAHSVVEFKAGVKRPVKLGDILSLEKMP